MLYKNTRSMVRSPDGDYRDAGIIFYVGGPTNQNQFCGKSGGGANTYEVPLDFKVGGT